MNYYRKKPVVVRAIQLNHANRRRVESLLESKGMAVLLGRTNECSDPCREDAPWLDLVIPTLEGDHLAKHGDWIIEGVQGELYPCKPDIFAATYEPIPSEGGGEGG